MPYCSKCGFYTEERMFIDKIRNKWVCLICQENYNITPGKSDVKRPDNETSITKWE